MMSYIRSNIKRSHAIQSECYETIIVCMSCICLIFVLFLFRLLSWSSSVILFFASVSTRTRTLCVWHYWSLFYFWFSDILMPKSTNLSSESIGKMLILWVQMMKWFYVFTFTKKIHQAYTWLIPFLMLIFICSLRFLSCITTIFNYEPPILKKEKKTWPTGQCLHLKCFISCLMMRRKMWKVCRTWKQNSAMTQSSWLTKCKR